MINQLSLTEALTAKIYGDTFALYNKQQFEDFLRPFEIRFERNGLDTRIFEGKRCLDAGCGGGRGSIFMARHGAKEVIGVDLSAKNVATSSRRAAEFGFDNLKFYQSTLHKLDLEDQSFDFVWCNGVLHHSDDPNAGMSEISRVLKVGGYLWLYLYGSGGIYWSLVDHIRGQLEQSDMSTAIALLLCWDVPIGRIAEFIDDWYVPWLRRYTHEDTAAVLEDLGFSNPEPLQRGTDYDTSERVFVHGERVFWGVGDLRYFVKKTSHSGRTRVLLPDHNRKGSAFTESELVTEIEGAYREVSAALDSLGERFWNGDHLPLRIGLFRTLQTELRALMSRPGAFPIDEYRSFLAGQLSRLTL